MLHAHKSALALFLSATTLIAADPACKGTLYLTLDTGSMKPAQEIREILHRQKVRATFFIANEKTLRGDTALDPAWAPFWKSLVADGHAFGSHTWRHWYFRADIPNNKVSYVAPDGVREALDQAQLCTELNRVKDAFYAMTGHQLDPIWRAPGGRLTPRTTQFSQACGYRHVDWSPAGFLGDELSSTTHPNQILLNRALSNLRDGDILMMHLGIRSRRDPFWPMLDPLLTGLKKKGFCFATIPERARQQNGGK